MRGKVSDWLQAGSIPVLVNIGDRKREGRGKANSFHLKISERILPRKTPKTAVFFERGLKQLRAVKKMF